MADYVQVRNWERFQHYRDRSPKWIKVYGSLLDDYDFSALDDADKYHLVGIWLLASRLDNKIPADPAWIATKLSATTPVDLAHLRKWLVSLDGTELSECVEQNRSMLLAEPEHVASPEKRERRVRGREEREDQCPTLAKPEHVASRTGAEPEQSAPDLFDASPHKPPSRSDIIRERFARFWAEYPRKTGKGAAENSWMKLTPSEELTHAILASVCAHKRTEQWTRDGGQYIPYPATWLNQRRWEDEPESALEPEDQLDPDTLEALRRVNDSATR